MAVNDKEEMAKWKDTVNIYAVPFRLNFATQQPPCSFGRGLSFFSFKQQNHGQALFLEKQLNLNGTECLPFRQRGGKLLPICRPGRWQKTRISGQKSGWLQIKTGLHQPGKRVPASFPNPGTLIDHVRENYWGSYYMRTVQWDVIKAMAEKLAGLAGCGPEELIITQHHRVAGYGDKRDALEKKGTRP